MINYAFGSDCEIVVLSWLCPHHELATPAGTKEPEFGHAVYEFEIGELLIRRC